jgi:hypothetical protein
MLAGRGGVDGAIEPVGLGDEADCRRVGVQPEYAEAKRLHAFSRHWGFRPWACAPYRARNKGKDERAGPGLRR